jgi:phospholipid/cholesterol/gamma-HCH transport system ATP-binding protein
MIGEPRARETGSPSSSREEPSAAVEFDKVSLAFDDHVVLKDLSFSVPKGEMRILLGASGAGKSLILKLTLGLLRPDSGTIVVFGNRVTEMSELDLLKMRADIGIVFQENALFDSLTVAENVGYRLYEETDTALDVVRARVKEVLAFLGLSEFIDRMPSSLSGGQRRRVGIGRAMASKPHLMLFDDSTTGLDPVISAQVNDEIVKLRDLEDVTSLVVSQQIRDAMYIATHKTVGTGDQMKVVSVADSEDNGTEFMVLHEGGILFQGSASELMASEDAYLKRFLYRTVPPW